MYPNTFYRVSVKAIIKNKEGQVLVLKENQDTWSLPGGGLDHGEDPKSGIARELKEELGIKNPNIKDVATVKTFYLEHKSAWLLWIVYQVEVPEQKLALGNGVTDAQYLDTSALKHSEDIFEQMVYIVTKDET
ncbi:MAG TPA: NUDIX domain-containing protein [Candidatus Saccharimonadales bacterium]|nr:NUDIX domain-containing protein [Candidatus Saccharimonadales bacterium]